MEITKTDGKVCFEKYSYGKQWREYEDLVERIAIQTEGQ